MHQILYEKKQRGHVALIGIGLMAAVVVTGVGFAVWTSTQQSAPSIVYTPPAVTAEDSLSVGKSSKELVQDVKILEAGLKRAEDYRLTVEQTLADKVLPIGGNTNATTVAQDRLSELQTDFIAECDRRIKNLSAAQPLLSSLTDGQRPVVEQLVNKEITDLNGIKARVAGTATQDAFDSARQILNQDYNSYLLAVLQLNLLIWANDQAVSEDKFNKVGGKFQERVDEAGASGKSTATSQTALNSLQASKVTAIDLTNKVVKVVPTILPGEQNSNRSVLKTYYDQLSTAHNELSKALGNAKILVTEAQRFDGSQPR